MPAKPLLVTRKFDWKTFFAKTEKLIKFASLSSIAPLDSTRWEEIVFHVMKNMGEKYKGGDPRWVAGSHAPGSDIWTDRLEISAKSGKLVKGFLCISSYRLTRFSDLKAMKEFIDGNGKNFDVYLCCARTEGRDGMRNYKVFSVPAGIVEARKMKWGERISKKNGSSMGWHGRAQNGVEVDIHKSMSSQLWIKIPLRLCTQVGEVTIAKNLQGSALSKILN